MKILYLFLPLFFACSLQAQTFFATVNEQIPDNGTGIQFEIQVSGLPDAIDETFGLNQICLNLNHTYDSDMDVRIYAPDGTSFSLFAGIGGGGHNFENCCLRDDSGMPIVEAAAPFTGTFRPTGFMGALNNGQNPNGIWRIALYDTYPFADQGTLIDWSITFENNAPGPFPSGSSNLPIAKITTKNFSTIVNEPKTAATLRIIDHGPGQENSFTDTTYAYQGDILVELQGYTGVYLSKKSYDIDLLDDQGLEIDTSLLGMPAENDWIFKSEYLDITLMENEVAYEFARRMGIYAPRTRPCELFVDGEYMGLYSLTEKVKRGKNRVDIAKLTPADTTGDQLTGGYIIEMNINGLPGAWNSAFQPINYATAQLPVEFKHVYPRSAEILPVQHDYIKAYVDSFEYSLHTPNFADPVNGYRKWIDEHSFIDFMLVNEFSTNYDSYGRSTFMYKEKDSDGGKLKIGPPWDYDRAFCCIDGWVWENTHPYWPFPDWWHIFHTDTLFLQQEYCRWHDLRADPLKTDAFMANIDSMFELIQAAQQRNGQRWPESAAIDYFETIEVFKSNLSQRLEWMDDHLAQMACGVPVEEAGLTPFKIYPNPAQDVVTLSGEPNGQKILIYNVLGKEIYRAVFDKSDLQIAIKNWPPGVYFVEIRDGGTKRVYKLVTE